MSLHNFRTAVLSQWLPLTLLSMKLLFAQGTTPLHELLQRCFHFIARFRWCDKKMDGLHEKGIAEVAFGYGRCCSRPPRHGKNRDASHIYFGWILVNILTARCGKCEAVINRSNAPMIAAVQQCATRRPYMLADSLYLPSSKEGPVRLAAP